MLACSGTSMFSATVSEREQRAALEQHAPARCAPHACLACRRRRCSCRTPRCCPRRPDCRPMIVRSSTDLPVPEPPTTPRISPRMTSRSRSSWMTWSPNWVRSRALDHDVSAVAWSTTSSRASSSTSSRIPRRCHRHHAQPSGRRSRRTRRARSRRKIDSTTALVVSSPTFLGAARDLHALEAADHARSISAEHRRLDHADPEVPERHRCRCSRSKNCTNGDVELEVAR